MKELANWIKLSQEEKRIVFEQAASKKGLPPSTIEKDWWVTITLRALFQSEIAQHLLFKGGTSLSKSWGLIERFSEDIDLALSRAYLGYGGDISKTQIGKLRKAAAAFTSNELPQILNQSLKAMSINDYDLRVLPFEDSDADPIAIELLYKSLVQPTDYISPRVLIEVTARSLTEPFEEKQINSFVSQEFSEADFADPKIGIPSVHPKRTFLEKLFLLHEEFQKPQGREILSYRKTRHLYDIYTIMNSPFADEAIEDKELYLTIVRHREKFNNISWVNYKTLLPKTLDFIPPDQELLKWEKDYREMSESMFYGETPRFEKLIEALKKLRDIIQQIEIA